jgi:hypothetical protein
MVIIEIKAAYVRRVMDEYHGNEIFQMSFAQANVIGTTFP